ncbi:M81 family metallopeptidase [Paenibacillus sp. IB182496]|uniref:M81 family metallopeptidase n=1 Tax=Paenibacillus sabuli TaxID=2772509 RepID=A0A927GTT5_9BACL|nr:M81 family metallopeptidase [Paenibacillus sabuli]MBD2847440.1 M81 family metallopeptidase [Paenibacillus sabuli]
MSKLRIVTGTLMHETNTFNRTPTTYADFRAIEGERLLEETFWADGSEATGGIIHTLQAEGAEIVPTLHARPFISGIIADEAYAQARAIILEAVRAAGPVDGVCLCLHGSMYTEAVPDPEGDLMHEVRAIVGPGVPIVCALDMHATVTEALLASVNAFTLFRTAPHTDNYDTGVRAADLLLKIIRQRLDVVTVSAKLPMLVGGEHSMTTVSPMKDMIAGVYAACRKPEVLNADYALGFPWADTPHHSIRTLVSGERRHLETLTETALELAEAWWLRRAEFVYSVEAYPLDEALDVAYAAESAAASGPVVVSDTGDNPTAGAACDATLVLERLLGRGAGAALVAVVADRRAYAACLAAGAGASIELELGRSGSEDERGPGTGANRGADAREAEPARNGRDRERNVAQVNRDAGDGAEDAAAGRPLRVTGTVLAVRDDLQAAGRARSGSNAAVLRIGSVDVVIAQERMAVTDPAYLVRLGLQPADYRVIVVKSGYQSPAYQELASRSLFALTPGQTRITLTDIAYRRAPRPIYPLDADTSWRREDERARLRQAHGIGHA